MHTKNTHLKVQHSISSSSVSLAWITPMFELYCVAGPNVSRSALAQGANMVISWVRREEERIFIIGGAVSVSFLSKVQTYLSLAIGVLKPDTCPEQPQDYLSFPLGKPYMSFPCTHPDPLPNFAVCCPMLMLSIPFHGIRRISRRR